MVTTDLFIDTLKIILVIHLFLLPLHFILYNPLPSFLPPFSLFFPLSLLSPISALPSALLLVENIDLDEDTKPVGSKNIEYFERVLRKKDHWNFMKSKGDKCEQYPNDPTCNLFSRGCTDTQFAYLAEHSCGIDSAKYDILLPLFKKENTCAFLTHICYSHVRYFKDFDYVVLNCGHHPAAASHFTYENFENLIEDYFKAISEIRKQRTDKGESLQLFWLENTAQPIRADDFVKVNTQ